MTPRTRCRDCGYIGYKPGPCHVCAVYGRYGPTDKIECVPAGQTAELRRWKKEAAEYRRLFQEARAEGDKLLARLRRAERLEATMARWERASQRAREAV